MAITSENTYLIYKKNTAYEKLVDIKTVPDLGGEPSTVDITTLSNHMKVGLPGLVDPGSLTLTANYTKSDYEKVKALEGTKQSFGVQFGKTAEEGTFIFDGEVTAWVNSVDVEAAVEFSICITPSSEITLSSEVKATIA